MRLALGDPTAAQHVYKVSTVTSDLRWAGTDANVTLQIFGSKADSGPQKLANSHNDFERARTDDFFIKLQDLGCVLKGGGGGEG